MSSGCGHPQDQYVDAASDDWRVWILARRRDADGHVRCFHNREDVVFSARARTARGWVVFRIDVWPMSRDEYDDDGLRSALSTASRAADGHDDEDGVGLFLVGAVWLRVYCAVQQTVLSRIARWE